VLKCVTPKAPPQSFTRTIRIAIIAAVLVATAGSFSLVDRSHDETSVAALTLVTPPPNSNPLSAQVKSRSTIQSDPTKPALLASRTDPVTAHVQKKANRSTKQDRIMRHLDACSIL
jgi:hypothetical protein